MFVNYLIGIFVFIFGLCIGSFLNCVIYRLEKNKKITGRSFCPHCKQQLEWQDLFPVFSFLFLKGKCRYCGKRISIQYPIVETITGLVFLLIFTFFTEGEYRSGTNHFFASAFGRQFSIVQFSNLIFLFYIASSLIVIFVYDLKHYIIPDKVLLPAIAVAFCYRLFENLLNWALIEGWEIKIKNLAPLGGYLLAALIGSGFFLLIFLVSRGRAMGFGDVKLAVLMGFLLGYPNILIALFLAFFFGAIIGLILMALRKKNLKSEISFGPFLITATLLSFLWGEQLIRYYLSLFYF